MALASIVRSVKFAQKGVGVASIIRYFLVTTEASGVTTSTPGWTTSAQTATSAKKYLWAYDKTIYSDGTTSSTTPIISSIWSGPVLPYPAGIYDSGKTYTATDKTAPYVLLEDIYYFMNKIGESIGINPQMDYAANGTNATWIPFEGFKAAFIEILMANFAKLASAVFYGNYMFSQQGVDASGNATNDYSQFGTSAFSPNILLNFLTGSAEMRNLIIKGISEFWGILKGVTGSFKTLDCINEDNSIVAKLHFGASGLNLEGNLDMFHGGETNDNGIFTVKKVLCRTCVSSANAVLFIQGSYGYYYPMGLGWDIYKEYVTLSSTTVGSNTVYYIPLDNYPSDIIILKTSSTYRYIICSPPGKNIMVANTNDQQSNYVYSQGTAVEFSGGEIAQCINVGDFFTPSLDSDVAGKGLLIGAFRNTNW